MTFVDRPLPATLELPRLTEPKPRDKRLDNLRFGPGIGRPKGTLDKIGRDLKNGIIEAAVVHGANGSGAGGLGGYLLMCATLYPKAYMQLLGKLLPMNLTANTTSQAISTVKIISVEAGAQYSSEQLRALERGEANLIDLQPEIPSEPPAAVEPEKLAPSGAQLDDLSGLTMPELMQRMLNLVDRGT
jgi:hypothetical protein